MHRRVTCNQIFMHLVRPYFGIGPLSVAGVKPLMEGNSLPCSQPGRFFSSYFAQLFCVFVIIFDLDIHIFTQGTENTSSF